MATGPMGPKLDDTKFRHELAIRGITARQLAEKAGISEVTVARCRRAAHVKPGTLLRLAIALSKIPVNAQLVKILPDLPGNGHAPADLRDIAAPIKTKTTTQPAGGRHGGQRVRASHRR
jgi:DNA-binding Xre family transcriptional regulator